MRKTLLEIVQEILSEMDSDEVNSISDTVESQQVAGIVRSCYNELLSNRNWPHLRKLTQLESSGTLARPTHMKMGDNLRELISVNYEVSKTIDAKKEYIKIKYLSPDEFLAYTNQRDSNKNEIISVTDLENVEILIDISRNPTYYTSFDDVYLVFDAYNSDVDDTLKNSKTQVLAYIEPSWVHEDSAIPDLPVDAFALLIEEAKSVSFITLKQTGNQKAEQRAARQNRWLSRKAWKAHGGIDYPNYGRK